MTLRSRVSNPDLQQPESLTIKGRERTVWSWGGARACSYGSRVDHVEEVGFLFKEGCVVLWRSAI